MGKGLGAAVAGLRGQFIGAMVGVAVGDALGMPYEGKSAAEIEARRTASSFPRRGTITDDTQLTILVARMLVDGDERFPREAFGRGLAGWLDAAINPGRACVTAARRLAEGMGPDGSGVMSAGCGAAMRAVPVGLRWFHSHRRLTLAAIDQATVTHVEARAVGGAIAVAAAAAWCVRHPAPAVLAGDRMLSFVSAAVRSTSEEMADLVLDCEGLRPLNVSGSSMGVVPAALSLLLRYPDSFEQAVNAAVLAGGDTDSVAAITGGLVGARVGIVGIPRRYREFPEVSEPAEIGRRLLAVTLATAQTRGAGAREGS